MKRRVLESSDDRGNWERASWHDLKMSTYLSCFGSKVPDQDDSSLWFFAKWALVCMGALLGLIIGILVLR